MTIKYITLLLLAFTCTPSTHACSGPNSGEIVALAGAIGIAEYGVLYLLNAPLINAKRLGFKSNLPTKNCGLAAAVGAAASMALALGGPYVITNTTKSITFLYPALQII